MSHEEQPSLSPSLLVRVQERDPAAWQRLHYLFAPAIRVWCGRARLSEADADDICQEVLQAVSRAIDDFRRDAPGASFRGWLCRITQNKIRDHWRRRARLPAADGGSQAWEILQQLPDENDASLSELPPGDENALLRRGLELVKGEFKDSTWAAFWRVTIEEQSAADVAAALGISTGAVYIAKSRVLARLREELGELLPLDAAG